MQAGNRRLSSWRACAAVALTLLLVLPEAPAYAQRRGRRRRGPVARVGQQRQPQLRGHGRELVERAHERHHEPHGDGQRLEPDDHGSDAQRRDGDGQPQRHASPATR